MTDTPATVVAAAKTDIATAETELTFVEANWGKLSAIFVAAFVIGLVVGHVL